VDEIAVDGDQAVAGPDAGFGGGSTLSMRMDMVFSPKQVRLAGRQIKMGK
jgi:hypothetical protein